MSRSAFWLLWGRVVFVGLGSLMWLVSFFGAGGFYGVGEFLRGLVSLWGWGGAGLLVMAASSNQNTLRNSRVRFIPYHRRAFSVPNISPVPEKPVLSTASF